MKIVERQVQDVTILDLHGKILIGEGDEALRDAVNKAVESGKAKLLLVKAQPAVAVAYAHGFVCMALKVGHKQSAAHGHDAANFAQAFCRVGKVVQHQVDAGKVCLAVAQGQVAQLAYAQRNAASGQVFGRKAAAAYFEHSGRAVHANEAAYLGQHAGKYATSTATKIHCGAAASGYRLANCFRKIK